MQGIEPQSPSMRARCIKPYLPLKINDKVLWKTINDSGEGGYIKLKDDGGLFLFDSKNKSMNW